MLCVLPYYAQQAMPFKGQEYQNVTRVPPFIFVTTVTRLSPTMPDQWCEGENSFKA
jgi:hypothetical protein